MISQSVLIERMKINGSLARKAMRTLEDMGLIKKVVHHHGQWVYSASSSVPLDSPHVG
jgi:small subunit ribosomal protein S25e